MERFLTRSNSVGKRPLEGPVDTSVWKVPKHSARPAEQRSSDPIETSNRFQQLSGERSNADASSKFREAIAPKKTSRIPPIILEIQSTWTHESVKATITAFTKSFHLQYRGNNRLAVLCHNPESHQAVKEGLQSRDIPFHTFSRKDEKLYKAVIFGLPDYVEVLLPDELLSLGFADVTVRKMKVPSDRPSFCPPFLVQLPPGTDFVKFRQIKLLCNTVVQIRKYQSNNRYGTQCFRCQGFGHSSRNCNLRPRCVKCTELHRTEDCPKKSRDEPAKCCNCGEDHPANYRQCREREKYLGILKERQEQHKAAKTTKILKSNLVDDRPWNSVAAANKTTSDYVEAPKTAKSTEHNILANDQTTKDMLEILMTIKNIKSQFVNCHSMMDKVILILTHLGRYV